MLAIRENCRHWKRKCKVVPLDGLVGKCMEQALTPNTQVAYTFYPQNFHRFYTTVGQGSIPAMPTTIMRYRASLTLVIADKFYGISLQQCSFNACCKRFGGS